MAENKAINGVGAARVATSVVSYTYNDASLLRGLLAEIPLWTRLPDEIIIVDDGSECAFALVSEQEKRLPVRILRNERNRGFCFSKSRGIQAAAHEYILSIDCDSRVSPNFLEVGCQRLLADKRMGMVSGASLYDSGRDLVSRYQLFFGDNYHHGVHGDVGFIPGHAFVLRRDAWTAVGGLQSHTRPVCEDHALCSALRVAGYVLFVDRDINIRQIRRLSRHAHCLRLWNWMHPEILAHLDHSAPLPQQLADLFIPLLAERYRLILELGDISLCYIEILYVLSMCLNTLAAVARNKDRNTAGEAPEFLLAACLHALKPYTHLTTLIKEDVVKFGYAKYLVAAIKIKKDTFDNWKPVTTVLSMFAEHGVLAHLNTISVPVIYEEDGQQNADFSSYEKNSEIT